MKYLHAPLESKDPTDVSIAVPGQHPAIIAVGVVGAAVGIVGFICAITFGGGGETYCPTCYNVPCYDYDPCMCYQGWYCKGCQ